MASFAGVDLDQEDEILFDPWFEYRPEVPPDHKWFWDVHMGAFTMTEANQNCHGFGDNDPYPQNTTSIWDEAHANDPDWHEENSFGT